MISKSGKILATFNRCDHGGIGASWRAVIPLNTDGKKSTLSESVFFYEKSGGYVEDAIIMAHLAGRVPTAERVRSLEVNFRHMFVIFLSFFFFGLSISKSLYMLCVFDDLFRRVGP